MKISFILPIVFLALSAIAGCSNQKNGFIDRSNTKNEPADVTNTDLNKDYPMSSAESSVDKVQVFLFHTTQRCATCIAIGKLAGETVNERFGDELKAGRIEFREVNIDLPENKALTARFQANGSALYLNAIKREQDNIEQDVKVWRLTGNPEAFKDYLESRIKAL